MTVLKVFENDRFQGNISFTDKDRIGSGATALIYKVNLKGTIYAAKIYNLIEESKSSKLKAMLENKPQDVFHADGGRNYIRYAWPLFDVRNDKGDINGFLMPYADKHDTNALDSYFDPVLVQRLDTDLEKALPFRLEIALNLCKLFDDLHRIGHYFIDVKPQNIRVYKRHHHVLLLDCDGFSIKSFRNNEIFPAELVSSDYISPESLRSKISPSALGRQQDLYALAVLLFQLLNNSTHPFQGQALNDSFTGSTNDDAAAAWLYPYGLTKNPNVRPRSQSLHEYWPLSLRTQFDRAFTTIDRPQASEWVAEFKTILENNALSKCKRHPENPQHIHFAHLPCMACSRSKSPGKSAASAGSQSTAASSNLTSAGERNLKQSKTASSRVTSHSSSGSPNIAYTAQPVSYVVQAPDQSRAPIGIGWVLALLIFIPLIIWSLFGANSVEPRIPYAENSRPIVSVEPIPALSAPSPTVNAISSVPSAPQLPAKNIDPPTVMPEPVAAPVETGCSLKIAGPQMCEELYAAASSCSDTYKSLLLAIDAIPEACSNLPDVIRSKAKSRVCLVACRAKAK
jgi:serine/threonine protein kinase